MHKSKKAADKQFKDCLTEKQLTKFMQMKLFKLCRLLFFVVFIIPKAGNAQINKPQTVNSVALINSISDSINKHYIFPEKAKSISIYLQSQLKKNANKNLLDSPEKLAKQIGHDINIVHYDPHMRVKFDTEFIPRETYKPTPQEIQQVKKYWKENNYAFKKVEILSGNIGYLSFNMFVDDIEAAKPTITAGLKFLINTNALIIDLRENIGGSPEMVSHVESYFFKEKTHMRRITIPYHFGHLPLWWV